MKIKEIGTIEAACPWCPLLRIATVNQVLDGGGGYLIPVLVRRVAHPVLEGVRYHTIRVNSKEIPSEILCVISFQCKSKFNKNVIVFIKKTYCPNNPSAQM